MNGAIEWLRVTVSEGAQLTTDSRQIRTGDVFLAYPGRTVDGRRYIPDAIARGAAAVIWDPQGEFVWNGAWDCPNRTEIDLKLRCGALAADWYGEPSRHLHSVGITGTSGKSSCALWIADAFSHIGRRAAVIGTLGVGFAHRLLDTGLTTPDPVATQRLLAQLVRERADVLAMEVSSIGLDEGRVAGMHYDTALFTNLSRDHLDYHGSEEAYERAKARLFAWPGLKHAVINMDDPAGARMADVARRSGAAVMGYCVEENRTASLTARALELGADGTRFVIEGSFGRHEFATPLLGLHNVSNLLGVLGVLLCAGVEAPAAFRALATLRPAPGRLERVQREKGPLVLVDYAHKPDALDKVLTACRPLAASRGGRLVVLFGCGGDRDRGKRPIMGSIAAHLADRVVVTSDNPRSEDPKRIIEEILAGVREGRDRVGVEPDRALAIRAAIRTAEAQDVIIVAGKGHERYQEVQGIKTPFSDTEVARAALAEWRATC